MSVACTRAAPGVWKQPHVNGTAARGTACAEPLRAQPPRNARCVCGAVAATCTSTCTMYVCGLARWPPRVWAGAMGRWGDSFHAAARRFRLGVYGEHTQGEHEDALAPLPLPRLFVGHPAALQRLARLVDRRPMPLLAASAALERLVAAVDRCANGGVGRKGHEASGAALEPRHVATRKPAAVPVLRSHRDVPALRAACALPQAFLAGGLQVARLSQRPRATGAALAVASEARGGAVALHGAMRLARRASDTPRVHANAPNKDAKTARTRCLTSLVRGIDAARPVSRLRPVCCTPSAGHVAARVAPELGLTSALRRRAA